MDITQHLSGIGFPAGKQDLIRTAKDNGADRDILEMIEGMPDEKFESMADVMKAYNQTDQDRRH